MNRVQRFIVGLIALVGIASADTGLAETSIPSAAVVGMDLIYTNEILVPLTQAERDRTVRMQILLGQLLEQSGRYRLVPVTDQIAAEVKARPNIAGCAGCQLDWGRRLGADLVVWGTVQKVSELILNMNVYIDDVTKGQRIFATSVDLRGNTDESWDRGMRYLVKYNLLGQ